jgi:hypothetical protein
MATPTFDIGNYRKRGAARRPRGDAESLRYRLDVVASSPADAVRAAGGWMYDRVAAGWEVTVVLPQGCDTRPLRILGVKTVDLDSALTRPMTQGLAVSAEVFSADPRVRVKVLKALDHRLTEVVLWGEGWSLPNRGMTRAQHILSAAARRFKGYALAAAGIASGAADPAEPLLCDVATGLSVDSELIRLG